MKRPVSIHFLIILTACILCPLKGLTQQGNNILTYKEFIQNLLTFHPISKQADLQNLIGDASMLRSKGGLDPQLSTDWNQKRFDEKLYYRQFQGKLRLPTLLGIDIVGGYENTDGDFLNPEATTDNFGLWHAGIEVNLLQGLLVNERRTAIQQARIFQEFTELQQQNILNDLIYEASSAYFNWQKYAAFDLVLQENMTIAFQYLENTRESFFNGEKSAMDTLEAFILNQDAITMQQKNELELIKARQTFENYLWFNDAPVTVQDGTRPEPYDADLLEEAISLETPDVSQHPLVLSALNKINRLTIDQRLKREKLKPKLKVKYNPLLATGDNSIIPAFSTNDFKLGFDFSMPLLFSQERGNIRLGELKIQEANLDFENKLNEIENKAQASLETQYLLTEQINVLTDNVSNYRRLLDAENERFILGESSVFLLNKRQEKYINSQLKLIDSMIKQYFERLKYLFFTNQLLAN
jgi:outer membrane protein TolC